MDMQTKLLVAKPLRNVLIDDVSVFHGETVTKEPGTQVVLKIVSADTPDGGVVRCTQKGVIDLTLEDEWELLFEGGISETKILITPAQGTKGAVHIGGKLMRPMTFCLRGFATI
jgi:hypothetical protein